MNFQHFRPRHSLAIKSFSLRSQVYVIVTILAIALIGAMIYVTETIGRTRESIIRFDRERLGSLTDDLSRRYGSVMNFVAPAQTGDSALAERQEFTKLLVNITEERLQNAPDVRAGFYHSLWNRQLADVRPVELSGEIGSADHYLRVLLQMTLDRQMEQWGHYESGGDNFIIVARPVVARNRLVGAAWAVDDLADEFVASRPFDITPWFQIAIVIGILFSTFFVINLRREVSSMQRGLEAMKVDITNRVPQSNSELGDVAASINGLADTIIAQQKERETLQKAIQQNEKLASLGQLIAGVAHEIRTPLTAIKTRIQLWQRAFHLKGKGSRASSFDTLTPSSMNLVVHELDRMEHIVRKLLYFSKQRTLHIQRTNLHELIDMALATLEGKLKKNRVRVHKELMAENPFLSVDAVEIGEVVLNLLTNAIESLPRGGDITVSTSSEENGSSVAFSVKDTGKGIKPAVAAKMFDPFFTTKDTGTGLGLSISYEIVNAHRGTIDYTRGSKGSRFTVKLPRTHRNRQR